MLKSLLFICVWLPMPLMAFRLTIKNEADIPNSIQLQVLYMNGFGRKYPHCITYLSKEQKLNQKYHIIKACLEAIITVGINYHKETKLNFPQTPTDTDHELDIMIRKINNLSGILTKLEANIREITYYNSRI